MVFDNTKVDLQQGTLPVEGVTVFKGTGRRGQFKTDLQNIHFADVTVTGGLWQHRMEVNRKATVPFVIDKCQGGRMRNFTKVGSGSKDRFEGIFYNDSDVYKAIEGAAKCLSVHRDAEMERVVDDMIDKIAGAQWEDGYLYTYYSLPERKLDKLWSDLEFKHELYCAGHLIEAAIAYNNATGKSKLLEVATRFADLICSLFGSGKREGVPGHQEIEIALLMLYRETGKSDYLHLAKFFLAQRGKSVGDSSYGAYSQDHLPVIKQDEAVGHTVRAAYMYCAMADVSLLSGSDLYIDALEKLWDNVVSCKMYLTGGVGARRDLERYGENYELPNDTAYGETCAALANVMWSDRMFRLKRDSKYIDVLERILYNGFLAGVSLSGDEFFYTNPLESDGKYKFNKSSATRKGWFNCSCCPTNVVRFVPTISSYIYAHDGESLYVNLYIPSRSSAKIAGQKIGFEIKTDYPHDGRIRFEVSPEKHVWFSVRMRIPGWSQGQPVPSDLYKYVNDHAESVSISINGKKIEYHVENGYAVINRLWRKGDVVEMDIPMPIRAVVCHENVENNRGKVALERGPIVYCAEQLDNEIPVDEIALGDDTVLKAEYVDDLLGGVSVISGFVGKGNSKFMAIPYYSWSHRGEGAMRVWFNGV